MTPAPAILVKGLPSGYDAEQLARVFFPGARPRAARGTKGLLVYARAGKNRIAAGLRTENGCGVLWAPVPPEAAARKLALCRLMYDLLCQATGIRPPWGLLTGVRPVSHLRKRLAQLGENGAEEYLVRRCDVKREKYAMARAVMNAQRPALAQSGPRTYSLYVAIPFCPSRCAYCSFVSQSVEREGALIEPYLNALAAELKATAAQAKGLGLSLAAVYIGGGTPTVLDSGGLERLLCMVERNFNTMAAAEYTVEAGRPDCTDFEKLRLIKSHGVGRISVNPQSLNDVVLRAIGRRHTAADVLRCYADARNAGFSVVNMDLIAGLPADSEAGFTATLEQTLRLRPENITLHNLTLKRASGLAAPGSAPPSSPSAMLAGAYPALAAAGYSPYYLYRQKGGVENLENTGWCLPGSEGLYNIYIMEEAHTILAAGAGACTKLVAANGSDKHITRIYSHKLPREYLGHFDDIIRRKQEGVEAFYARYMDSETAG